MVTVKTPQTLLPEKDGLARNRHALGETTLLARDDIWNQRF